uniref:Uncharacterized protein n=1 Tax=Scophthalmus maximus TaxID=52904 RepID=A0A8D2ZN93_SCOMX
FLRPQPKTKTDRTQCSRPVERVALSRHVAGRMSGESAEGRPGRGSTLGRRQVRAGVAVGRSLQRHAPYNTGRLPGSPRKNTVIT